MLTSTGEDLSIARRSLDELEDDLSREQLENARLLVTELATDSVLHVSAASDESTRLQVTKSSGALRVKLTDADSWKRALRDHFLLPEAPLVGALLSRQALGALGYLRGRIPVCGSGDLAACIESRTK